MTSISSKRAGPVLSTVEGFTLVELILYVGLTAIVVVALTRVLLTVIGTRERVEIVSVLQQEAGYAFDRMITETLHAVSVSTGASLFDQKQGMLTLVHSGSGSSSQITFSLSGTTLTVATGTGQALPLTSSRVSVDELFFHSLSGEHPPRAIRIRLHARDAGADDRKMRNEATYETTVSLRNK